MPKVTQKFDGPAGTMTRASGPQLVLLKQPRESFLVLPSVTLYHPNSSCQARRGQRGHSLPRIAAGTIVSKWHPTKQLGDWWRLWAVTIPTHPCPALRAEVWVNPCRPPVSRDKEQQIHAASHAPCRTAAAGLGWEQDNTGTARDNKSPHCPYPALSPLEAARSPGVPGGGILTEPWLL